MNVFLRYFNSYIEEYFPFEFFKINDYIPQNNFKRFNFMVKFFIKIKKGQTQKMDLPLFKDDISIILGS